MNTMQRPAIPLESAFSFQEGPGLRKWQFRSDGIKVLNVGNITKEGRLDLSRTDRFISMEEVKSRYEHFLVDEGDLVIASSGISFDEDGLLRTRGVFVSKSDLPLCMNTSTIRFKAKQGVSDLRYLRHWIDGIEFRKQISRLVTGSAQQNFGPSHLRAISISLPPLDEQRRLAAILDKADTLRRERKRALGLANSLQGEIFANIFGPCKPGEQDWPTVKVAEAGRVQLGRQRAPKYQTGKFSHPYVRVANVFEDRIDISDVLTMDFDERDFRDYKLEDGDILLNEGQSTELVGRPAMWRSEIADCCFQNTLVRFQAHRERILPEFALGLFLRYFRAGEFAKISSKTSSVAHLGAARFGQMPFPVPPINLQRSFAEKASSVKRTLNSLCEAETRLCTLFSSLQSRAFSGEL
jgi:type I restriction enzyme, S subunit